MYDLLRQPDAQPALAKGVMSATRAMSALSSGALIPAEPLRRSRSKRCRVPVGLSQVGVTTSRSCCAAAADETSAAPAASGDDAPASSSAASARGRSCDTGFMVRHATTRLRGCAQPNLGGPRAPGQGAGSAGDSSLRGPRQGPRRCKNFRQPGLSCHSRFVAKEWGLEWRLVPPKGRESCRWQSLEAAWVAVTLGHQGDITKIVVTASDGRYEVVDGYEEGLSMARRWRGLVNDAFKLWRAFR